MLKWNKNILQVTNFQFPPNAKLWSKDARNVAKGRFISSHALYSQMSTQKN